MRVLLTGGSGFVGRHVAVALARAGHRLRCLVRATSETAHLEAAGHELARGHLMDPDSLAAAVRGVDGVVHVAGLVRARSFAEFRDVNVMGTAGLAGACAREASQRLRFVLVSSQAAAGPSRGRAVTEDDPPRPVSWYGRSKLMGERAAAAALGGGTRLTVVRPPAVYGPHDRDIFEFFAAANRGVRLRVGTRPRAISVVHAEDLAEGIRLALESGKAGGRTYFLANQQSRSLHELLAAIATAVGRPGRSLYVPEPVLRAVAVVADEIARIRRAVPKLGRDKAREFLAPGWLCDSSRAREELGWRPAITLEDGLAATARWYRDAGWM